MERLGDNSANNNGKTHLIWPDLLKILAIYAVIVIHTAAPYLILFETNGLYDWWAGNLYDSIARWCIPVFVMLSGLFLIDKYREETFRSFFAKRFTRVLVPLIVWSFIYFLWRIYANNEELSFASFIPMLFIEPVYYHLWFMYLLIGLYLLAPLLGIYMKHSCCCHAWYYLALWFALVPVLTFIESWFDITTYISPGAGNTIFEFTGYFILGWMLRDFEARPATKILLVLFFLTGLFITAYGTYLTTIVRSNGQFRDLCYEYWSFNVFMMSVSIFLLGKGMKLAIFSRYDYGRKALHVTAACVPGIYLVHAMVLAAARRGLLGIEFTPDMMDPFVGIPVFALVVFAASLLIVFIVKNLPVIKYIVPSVLLPTVFAASLHAADAPPMKLIEKDEFKTLTSFARAPLKKKPDLEAWEKAVPQVSVISIRSTHDKTDQKALFYDSGSLRKKPLLIVLHSWSEDYTQSFGIPYGRWAVQNDWVFIQPDYRGAFTNPQATASAGAVSDILDALEYAKENANVDTSRVYLAGFSGGGMAALIMAGKYPDKWAGVVSWGAVYDLTDWHSHTRNATRHYSKDIAASCGGPPVPGTAQERECRKRSPSKYLKNAKGKVPVYIAVGSDDSFVPPAHSLRAFNDLADEEGRLSGSEIEHISEQHSLPPDFAAGYSDRLFADAGVPLLYERKSGMAVLKIYKGKHDVVYNAGLAWLAKQER